MSRNLALWVPSAGATPDASSAASDDEVVVVASQSTSIQASRAGLIAAVASVAAGIVLGAPQARAEDPVYAAVIVDAATGEVLHEVDADVQSYPASLTKIMTLYVTFGALDGKRLTLDERLPVSLECAQRAPSKLRLKVGSTIRVDDAIQGLVTKSANDAACVIAEHLAGSEDQFAQLMTRRAREIGMTRTVFRNASGLPVPEADQVTTARDMARLSLAVLRDYPHYYHFFSVQHFRYQGQVHRNHNRMLERYAGVDGIKTGYIHASGFNIAVSAVRDGRRLVGVVFGGRSAAARDEHMARLLDMGFLRAATPRSPLVMAAAQAPYVPPAQQAGTGRPAAESEAWARTAYAERAPAQPSYPSLRTDRAERWTPVAPQSAAAQPVRPAPEREAPAAETRAARRGPSAEDLEALTRSWGVQVGAYGRWSMAHLAVTNAAKQVPQLAVGRIAIVPIEKGSETLYRARLIGLSKAGAQEACRILERRDVPCALVQPGDAVTVSLARQPKG
ncbi:MAG: serine hydrolase [Alphaproteobacteria bacterium]|nr:serine hydrolase [Alphaproteobacteria bacterium]